MGTVDIADDDLCSFTQFNNLDWQEARLIRISIFKLTENGLLFTISWADQLLLAGQKTCVLGLEEALKKHSEMDEVGDLTAYVGCQLDYNTEEGWMKITSRCC